MFYFDKHFVQTHILLEFICSLDQNDITGIFSANFLFLTLHLCHVFQPTEFYNNKYAISVIVILAEKFCFQSKYIIKYYIGGKKKTLLRSRWDCTLVVKLLIYYLKLYFNCLETFTLIVTSIFSNLNKSYVHQAVYISHYLYSSLFGWNTSGDGCVLIVLNFK